MTECEKNTRQLTVKALVLMKLLAMVGNSQTNRIVGVFVLASIKYGGKNVPAPKQRRRILWQPTWQKRAALKHI
jgi:hypothetical protein